MSNLQTFLPLLKETISDIHQADSMSLAQKKIFVINTITKLLTVSSLSQEEKDLINMILPLLASPAEIIEDVKGCFQCLIKKANNPSASV